MDGIQELAHAAVGLPDIVDDHIRPPHLARDVTPAQALQDSTIACTIPCRQTRGENVLWRRQRIVVT